MIVSVCGNIIETEHIYAIKKVASKNSSTIPNFISEFYFHIILHNNYIISIGIDVCDLMREDGFAINTLNLPTGKSPEDYSKIAQQKVNKVRDELIGYCSENKSKIIHIEF